jgi:16S rRNA (uracil1498-N3)-methyltransferase
MRRFFADFASIGDTHITIREPADRNHIKNVLRMGVGDEAIICDGAAFEYRARIEEILPDGIRFEILDKQMIASEPSTFVTLFQGVPKQGKMETIIQKAVELGVSFIVPVYTMRSVPKGDIGSARLKRERWARVAAEAAKQCRRGRIPEVGLPISGEELPARLSGFGAVIFPYEDESDVTMKDVLNAVASDMRVGRSSVSSKDNEENAVREDSGAASPQTRSDEKSVARISLYGEETAQTAPYGCGDSGGAVAATGRDDSNEAPRVALVIGPEGGMTEKEAAALIDAGAKPCSLGRRVLRTETAGPAALAMMLYEWDL